MKVYDHFRGDLHEIEHKRLIVRDIEQQRLEPPGGAGERKRSLVEVRLDEARITEQTPGAPGGAGTARVHGV